MNNVAELEVTDMSALTDRELENISNQAFYKVMRISSDNFAATKGLMDKGTPYDRWNKVGNRARRELNRRKA